MQDKHKRQNQKRYLLAIEAQKRFRKFAILC